MIKLTELDGGPVWVREIVMVRTPKSWDPDGGRAYVELVSGSHLVVREPPDIVLRLIGESSGEA